MSKLEPLDIRWEDETTRKAWDILHAAQKECRATSLVFERADRTGYFAPETPGEYLWWMFYEATMQEVRADNEEKEFGAKYALESYQSALCLYRYGNQLAALGVRGHPPTKKEE